MLKENVYFGQMLPDETALVLRDGKVMPPGRSLEVRNHSPAGFNWGYEGSGPAQLALALLLDATSARALSERYHQQFKREVVAKWSNLPGACWKITSTTIKEWLADRAFNEGSEDSDNP